MLITGSVISKDGSSGKAEHLGFGKEFDDIFVGFAKLGTVAFVKDKHNAFIFQALHCEFMALGFDRSVEFLDSGDNEGVIPSHLVNELFGAIGGVYAVGAEIIKLSASLVIEVSPINNKQHFMHFGELGEDLSSFEAGEGFA